ncbi:protein of unknown function [Nitrospira japonica]|uniref:Uncharacterized protein n=1 Tax=Nitrospira japonica TaxID=1325564 RepID=A0A1W1I3R1_9BACT|nr:protein of unknown function [Nitrospira japonica]
MLIVLQLNGTGVIARHETARSPIRHDTYVERVRELRIHICQAAGLHRQTRTILLNLSEVTEPLGYNSMH